MELFQHNERVSMSFISKYAENTLKHRLYAAAIIELKFNGLKMVFSNEIFFL